MKTEERAGLMFWDIRGAVGGPIVRAFLVKEFVKTYEQVSLLWADRIASDDPGGGINQPRGGGFGKLPILPQDHRSDPTLGQYLIPKGPRNGPNNVQLKSRARRLKMPLD